MAVNISSAVRRLSLAGSAALCTKRPVKLLQNMFQPQVGGFAGMPGRPPSEANPPWMIVVIEEGVGATATAWGTRVSQNARRSGDRPAALPGFGAGFHRYP
jgi:hypothetical protein